MRLLICTQTVDANDPVLGFFCRWIEEFARQCDHVDVICLNEGEHHLPSNVAVHSLGKERGAVSTAHYALRFWKQLFLLHGRYDAVFVHMNPEYVLLGGTVWRLTGKRVGMWYVHKSVTLRLRFAAVLTSVIFTTSRESCRLRSAKICIVGHGIDPMMSKVRAVRDGSIHIITTGRISPTKRLLEMLAVCDALYRRGTAFTFSIVGAPGKPEEVAYERILKETIAARPYHTQVQLVGAVPHTAIPALLAKHTVFLNLSATGSIDKAVLEAACVGLAPVTSNEAFCNLLSPYGLYVAGGDLEQLADAVTRAALFDTTQLREQVVERNVLQKVAQRISQELLPHRTLYIVTYGTIGDCMLLLACIQTMERYMPQYRVVVITTRNAPLLREMAAEYPTVGIVPFAFVPLLREWVRTLFRKNVCIVPPTFHQVPWFTRLLAWLLCLRGSRAGFVWERSAGRYEVSVPFNPQVLFSEHLVALLVALGCPVTTLESPRLPESKNLPTQLKGVSYIALAPFAASPTRSLPESRWVALLARVRAAYPEQHVVLLGGPADTVAAQRLCSSGIDGVVVLCGLPFAETVSIIRQAVVYVGVDSGLTHVAGMLRAPSVVVGNRSNPTWLPRYNPNATVLTAPGRCVCRGDKTGDCYDDINGQRYFRCMVDISDEEIVAAIGRVIVASPLHHD